MIKQLKIFSPIYICLLLLDIFVKLNLPLYPYRYISKPIVIGSLLLFVAYNCFVKKNFKGYWLFYALILFFIGDLLTIEHTNNTMFIISMVLFIIGKLLYTLKFMHKEDFNIKRLLPFMVLSFFYVAFLYNLIFHNLEIYFIPVTIYFFISLLMFLFAFIRKNVVTDTSYYTVLVGVSLFVIFETILVIKKFYQDIIYQDFLIMFCYALGQYLIIVGLLIKDKKLKFKSNRVT